MAGISEDIRKQSAMMRRSSMKKECLGRWILTAEGLVDGYMVVEGGLVAELCHGEPPDDAVRAIILPGLVNAHTHVADSVAYPAPRGSVEELVAPPDGYKHRVLRTTSYAAKSQAMRMAMETMLRTGTTLFADFREEGIEGVDVLVKSIHTRSPRAVILGRPATADDSDHDIDLLLKVAHGIGMSSVRDWPLDFLERLSRKAHAQGKLFAIHASECVREDIDAVLGLAPDFVVHMTKASEQDIAACVERRVPIVVCPRSNAHYGLTPDFPRMLRMGATVALGTDNGMLCRPDLFEELKAAFAIGQRLGKMTPSDAVNMATFSGRKVLNQMGKILTKASLDDDLAAVRVKGNDPLLELVTSAGSQDVVAVVKGGRVWRAESWKK